MKAIILVEVLLLCSVLHSAMQYTYFHTKTDLKLVLTKAGLDLKLVITARPSVDFSALFELCKQHHALNKQFLDSYIAYI